MALGTSPASFLPLYVPDVVMEKPANGHPEMLMTIDPKQSLKGACSLQLREAQNRTVFHGRIYNNGSTPRGHLLSTSARASRRQVGSPPLSWDCVHGLQHWLCHWMVQRRRNTSLGCSSASGSEEFPLFPIKGGQGLGEPELQPHAGVRLPLQLWADVKGHNYQLTPLKTCTESRKRKFLKEQLSWPIYQQGWPRADTTGGMKWRWGLSQTLQRPCCHSWDDIDLGKPRSPQLSQCGTHFSSWIPRKSEFIVWKHPQKMFLGPGDFPGEQIPWDIKAASVLYCLPEKGSGERASWPSSVTWEWN